MFFGIGSEANFSSEANFISEANFVTKEEIYTAYKLFQYAKYAGNEECDECLELCRKDLAREES